jgi:cell division protein FtsN
MKKYMVLCAGLSLAMVLTGCKSKESAYKQAYEKAKAAESAQTQPVEDVAVVEETPVVTPVQTRPVTKPQVVDNVDNVAVRQERVSVVNGSGLRDFSVVVGSFSVIANAEGLQQKLKNAGYAAQVVKNDERNMYRVVASTFDDKASAVQSRDELRGNYPDAWLLYQVK